MNLVSTTLRCDIDSTSGIATILSAEVVRLYFEFLGVVDRGKSRDLIEKACGAGNTIDKNLVGLRTASINSEVRVPRRVDGDIAKLSIRRLREGHSGCKRDETKGAAPVEWEVLYSLTCDHLSHR